MSNVETIRMAEKRLGRGLVSVIETTNKQEVD